MASAAADAGITSFQKRGKTQIPHVPGTRQSVQTAQLLTSSGIPALDHLIGGSLPVGSLLLIEEDIYGTFAKVILKYFLAEGAANRHALFLASLDVDPQMLIKQLPSPVETDGAKEGSHANEDSMTIAWRYQNMRLVESAPGLSETHLGHNFDLTKTMTAEEIEQFDISLWHSPECGDDTIGGFLNPAYGKLLQAIQKKILQGEYRILDNPKKHNVLRIALHSLASPLWVSDTCIEPNIAEIQQDLPRFLFLLRCLLRDAYAVAVITIPTHLYENCSGYEHLSSMKDLCEHQSDFAMGLESFAGSSYETNLAFKDYHGLLHIQKIGCVNALATHVPESLDLGFKLKRKKFVIEKLHLPPELQESAQREQDDITSTASKTGLSCATGQGSKLDF